VNLAGVTISMMGKAIAAWLILLTVSPFTEPFSACDLTALIVGSAVDALSAPASTPSVTRSRTDAALSQVVTVRRTNARVKFVALFGHVAPLTRPHHHVTVLGSGRSAGTATTPPLLRAVLRI
jgi:hypothetical protein